MTDTFEFLLFVAVFAEFPFDFRVVFLRMSKNWRKCGEIIDSNFHFAKTFHVCAENSIRSLRFFFANSQIYMRSDMEGRTKFSNHSSATKLNFSRKKSRNSMVRVDRQNKPTVFFACLLLSIRKVYGNAWLLLALKNFALQQRREKSFIII